MNSIDIPARPVIPVTAYGMATATSTIVAAILAVAFFPHLAGPCSLGALGLGLLHVITHQTQGSLFDTLVPMGALTTILAMLGAGLAEVEPSLLGLSLLALVTQLVWFATFVGLHDE